MELPCCCEDIAIFVEQDNYQSGALQGARVFFFCFFFPERADRQNVATRLAVTMGDPDNHWLDCLVGCAVAASIQGLGLPGTDTRAASLRASVPFSELRRSKR
jgi:hypothetical protein